MIKYQTERLILRNWQDSDTEAYIALNQDPEVLRYFPRLYSKDESIADIVEYKQLLIERGYTIYACELKACGAFIGFVGLYPRDDMPFSPCVEIGWRLAKKYWGYGYAPEAAIKCLEIGFNECNLHEIVSFTPTINTPSERVMQKIGMLHHDNFYHYKVPEDHALSKHVLYKFTKEQFQTACKT